MEQGDESLRSANIVSDPVDATNKVLRMRITNQIFYWHLVNGNVGYNTN